MMSELIFDLNNIDTIEFGVGQEQAQGRTFYYVPANSGVQKAVQNMVVSTWRQMQEIKRNPDCYSPAEKYESREHLYLPLSDDLAKLMRELHYAVNLPCNAVALENPSSLFCYFTRLKDKKEQRLTALRRATQFKGVVKKPLLEFVTDSLKLIENDVFKLDKDFDLLVDNDNLHILRASEFELAVQLQQAILESVPTNIQAVKNDLKFVDFSSIEQYAGNHPRAARYLASIKAQGETKNINQQRLKTLCRSTGVQITEENGKIQVDDRDIMGFLEVLDRRRYEFELVHGQPEQYRAGSRNKLNRNGGSN
jgi:hypothetical protein